MTRLDTDRYYDGGNLPGELTERQWDAAEKQAAADERSVELREAILCVIQAQGAVVRSTFNTPKDHRGWTYQVLAKGYLDCAERCIRKAGGKE